MAEKIKLLKPKIDVVFQSLFSKQNERITKAFAEALLDEKVEKIKINENKELYRTNPEDKLGILDLELEINEREKVDIEIQLVDKSNIQERILYYFSKLYSNEINRGDDYKKAKRVIMVAILDYNLDLTKEINKMETKWKLREENNKDLVLTDKLEIDIIELSKVQDEYEKNKQNKKAQWALFISDPNKKEVQEIMKNNEDIEEAVVTVHKMTEDEKMRKLADLREKALLDEKAIRRKGYEDGKSDGRIEERAKNIKRMKQLKMSDADICKILDITNDELQKLTK